MSESNYSRKRYRPHPRRPTGYEYPHLKKHSIIRDGCDVRLLVSARDDPLEGSPLLKILEEEKGR